MPIEQIEFNFEEWALLAQRDPLEFERCRRETLQRLIISATNTRRAVGLQCRIDLERIRAHTPFKAVMSISAMMWDSFHKLNDQLDRLIVNNPGKCLSIEPESSGTLSKVIPFPTRGGIP